MAATATAIFLTVLVVSTVPAEAMRPMPTTISCRDFQLTGARTGYDGRSEQMTGPAERAARLARTTAATVHGASRNSRNGGSYIYSESDRGAIVVADNTGRAIAVLAFDSDESPSRVISMVECEP
jgi:hypothetical protein